MRAIGLSTAITLVVLASCSRAHQSVTGPLPAFVSDTSGKVWITIKRQVDPKFATALRIAEAVPPNQDSLQRLARRVGYAPPRGAGTNQWWYNVADGIRLPYAITGAGLAYYLELAKNIRRGRNPVPGLTINSAELTYTAEAAFQDTLTIGADLLHDVIIVRLTLRWGSYCGDLCSLSFSKVRRVVLTHDGRVIQVEGDGLAPGLVSMGASQSKRRAYPRIEARTLRLVDASGQMESDDRLAAQGGNRVALG